MTGSLSKVVQITNIAPQATKDQMASLFGSLGKIDDLRLYPTIRDVSVPVVSRICYIKFLDPSSVAVAQHMSNTVFIDRALVVIPVASGTIPDEFKAIEMLNNGTLVPGLQSSTISTLPPECINRIEGCAPNQVITTSDPKLDQNDLPKYPSLPVNFDARRIEETRRTILVLNAPADWTVEELIAYFEGVGEVKYGRVAEKDEARHVMIEFSEQKTVVEALKRHGEVFKGQSLNLYHSTEPIQKPQTKSNEAAQKEIEEAMTIVKEAQSMISAAIDPIGIGMGMLTTKEKAPVIAASSGRDRRRSRSRSRDSRRVRNRSRGRGSRRSRSRSPRRSRSRSRRRSRSRSKRSSSRRRRSRSRDRRRKSKSRQRSRSRDRSRDRDRDRDRDRSDRRKDKRRDRDRDRDKRSRKSPSRYRSRSRDRDRDRDRKSKRRSPDYPKKIKRDYDDEEKIGQDGSVPRETKKGGGRARTPSPAKSDHMDLSSP